MTKIGPKEVYFFIAKYFNNWSSLEKFHCILTMIPDI
jgi:hypothetical protein